MPFQTTVSIVMLPALLFTTSQTGSGSKGVSVVPDGSVSDRLISLEVRKARLADVVIALGEKYEVNIVADAYADDWALPSVEVSAVPLTKALPQLAALYQREVEVVNGIIVLRHRRWFMRSAQEQFSAEHYGITWKDTGTIKIERHDGPHLKTRSALTHHASTSEGRKQQDVLPPPSLSLHVNSAPLKNVASVFNSHIGWVVRIDPSLANRRVSISMRHVTPGQALEALTWLLNARQQVTLGQNEAQKKQEAEMTDPRSDREKMSDALKADLMRYLTPEQRAALENGKAVELSIQSLPSGLRTHALQYVRVATNSLAPGLLQPDESRFSEFSLQIRPEPFLGINVIGYGKDGGRIAY